MHNKKLRYGCNEIGNVGDRAQSANAKCRMQNAKLRDDCNEVQTVGDDVLGVPINAKCKIETENLIHRHHAPP